MPLSIYLVDDSLTFLTAVRGFLEQLRPDLVLLDLARPKALGAKLPRLLTLLAALAPKGPYQ